jgi:phosphatidylglycerol:prolipoprotein diacylglycerol transferase
MRQILFVVPGVGVKVYGFGLMFVVACFAALYATAWRARREKIDPNTVFDLAVWLMSGGLVGARLFYVIQHHETLTSVWDVFRIWQGGLVFYGCIIGGLAGSLIYWRRHPFPFWAMADAVAPSLALGAALGRLGCWLNGCCFGGLSGLPWAVRFPAGSLAWYHQVYAGWIPATALESLAIHPAQLYAAVDGLILFALLSAYFPFRKRDGEVMALLMVTYPLTRFLIESLRDDERAFFAGLTISQNISVLLFAGGLLLWARLLRLPVAGLPMGPPGHVNRLPLCNGDAAPQRRGNEPLPIGTPSSVILISESPAAGMQALRSSLRPNA